MNRLGQIRMPPLAAAVNVASQLKRQILPSQRQNANPDSSSQAERVTYTDQSKIIIIYKYFP